MKRKKAVAPAGRRRSTTEINEDIYDLRQQAAAVGRLRQSLYKAQKNLSDLNWRIGAMIRRLQGQRGK